MFTRLTDKENVQNTANDKDEVKVSLERAFGTDITSTPVSKTRVLTLPEKIGRYDREAGREAMSMVRYMEEVQQDINPKHREKLIDWLIAVTDSYGKNSPGQRTSLSNNTLHTTVNLLDRFLSGYKVTREKF